MVGRRKIPVPPKEVLEESYKRTMSIHNSATEFKVSYETMRMWLKTNNIQLGEKGYNHNNSEIKRKPMTEEHRRAISRAMQNNRFYK